MPMINYIINVFKISSISEYQEPFVFSKNSVKPYSSVDTAGAHGVCSRDHLQKVTISQCGCSHTYHHIYRYGDLYGVDSPLF